jgi:hypothetical protein
LRVERLGAAAGKRRRGMPPGQGAACAISVSQTNAVCASVLSYIRNSSDLGNKSSVVTEAEVKEVRSFTQYKVEGGTTLRGLEIGKLGRAENKNWDRDRDKKKK